ncbi:hypothetical protein H0H81_008759 [Sphagnurus paluster]|uniref:F-box protein n=1 Tax=Sphagnurus paluster TaxID=117069 RepID=A0A9P7KGE2_9AGAR|nr:hypothetical protein H0H81_008759 [Sphagnurus paluster]
MDTKIPQGCLVHLPCNGHNLLKTSIFPFKQLTHIEVKSYITAPFCESIMLQFPALQDASFSIGVVLEQPNSYDYRPAPIILPHLLAFKLEFVYASCQKFDTLDLARGRMSTLMSNIDFPALGTLMWGAQNLSTPLPLSILIEHESHTLKNLRSLVLMRVLFDTPAELTALLGACPALESFALFPATSSVTPISVLRVCTAAPLPNLRDLAVAFYTPTVREIEIITQAFPVLLHGLRDSNSSHPKKGVDFTLYFRHDNRSEAQEKEADKVIDILFNQLLMNYGEAEDDNELSFELTVETLTERIGDQEGFGWPAQFGNELTGHKE